MRSKEEAHDYRYFPEPDLVPVEVNNEWIESIKRQLMEQTSSYIMSDVTLLEPDLPDQKRQRFIRQYGLPEYDADLLISERAMAEWFEQAVKLGADPKTVSNWMMGELTKLLNEENKQIEECGLKPEDLVGLLELIDKGIISGKIAKIVFGEMYKTGKDADTIVKEKGLVQISDEADIEKAVNEVLEKNPEEVERFKAGDEKLMGFFIGQIMKVTKGKANPKIVNELLKKKLS